MKRAIFGLCALLAMSGAIAEEAGSGGSTPAPADSTSPDYVFCTVCHGAHGNGNLAINAPKIAGIEPWYLKQQLAVFRAGMRGTKPTDVPGMEMQPVGVQLDDAAIEAVASYVATFKPVTPPVTVQGDARRGRELYATCSGCHGARGEGNGALKAPALAGQNDWYLVRQLERFQSGERGFAAEDAPGSTMRAAAAALPDTKAVNDLVAYINTLSAKHRGT